MKNGGLIMFQNIDELKNEIEVFRDNMNRSNGSIALMSDAIEQLNSNLHNLKLISEKFDSTRNELELNFVKMNNTIDDKFNNFKSEIKENIDSLNQQIEGIRVLVVETSDKQSKTILSTLETLKASCEQKLQREFKTIKILGGIITALLVVSIILNLL